MKRSNETQTGAGTQGDRVSQVKLDGKRAHSKTMRLDILPNGEALAQPLAAATRMSPAVNQGLTLSPAMLNLLYQNAYDAMLITDVAGKILSGNLRANEYLVGEGESLIGFSVLDLISGAEAELLERLDRTLGSERFVRIHAWCRRSSGAFFPAEIAVHRIAADGNRFLCFFMHDITWRKETEDRLQMADVAMQTTHAGVAVIDMSGNLIFANPALNKLFGSSFDETGSCANLAGFLADPDVPDALMQTIVDGEPWHGRIEVIRPDGSRLMAECDAVGNRNSDGDLIGAVLSFNDMTDHIRANEAERKIERNRVMMASIGSVCHHLGQPSTVLLNSIEMLLRLGHQDSAQREELLRLSLSAAESLGKLLRDLNDLRDYRSEAYLSGQPSGSEQIVAIDNAHAGIQPDHDVIG